MNREALFILIIILISCGSKNTISTDNNSGEEIVFSWNFNKKKKLIYSYSQIRFYENNKELNKPINERMIFVPKTIINGNLNITVKENSLADVSVNYNEVITTKNDKGIISVDTIVPKTPTLLDFADMQPDGILKNSIAETKGAELLKYLMPIPNKKMKIGDLAVIPIQIPFDFYELKAHLIGKNTLTFKGFKEINGRNCAILSGTIEISQNDLPNEVLELMEGNLINIIKGNATYYFDFKEGIYIGADAKIKTENGTTLNTDRMIIENTYKFRLERIE